MKVSKITAGLAVWFLALSLSQAQVATSYEGFGAGYTPNQTFGANAIPSSNATVSNAGYTSNWLEIGSGAYPKASISPNSLNFSVSTGNIITSGGALKLETNARLGREVAVSSGPGTIYFSFLYQLENVSTNTPEPTVASPYFGVEFWKNDTVAIKWRETPAFYSDGTYNLGSDRKFTLRGNDTSVSFTGIDLANPLKALGQIDDKVNLVVFKLQLTGIPGQDTISIWKNPDLDTGGIEPSPAQAQVFAQASNQTLDFNAIAFANYFGNKNLYIDEIRFGNSFSEVINAVAIPEPTTVGLLVIGGIVLLLAARRKVQSQS
jgi:hypothetical protein